jgi:hypothetical protein
MTQKEMVEEQLKALVNKVSNKTVGKNLTKAAKGQTTPIKEVIALNSLLTHALIEFKTDARYILSVAELYKQVGDLIAEIVKSEKR